MVSEERQKEDMSIFQNITIAHHPKMRLMYIINFTVPLFHKLSFYARLNEYFFAFFGAPKHGLKI